MAAFIVNKQANSLVDNASFLAPLLVGLQIYDLISDVNLGFTILSTDNVVIAVSNPYFLCGAGILFFTVLPFVSNLYYAMTLPQQKVIAQNTAASTYFKNRLTEFVLLVVYVNSVDGAMIMAFTASLLSVVATLAAYHAQSSSDKSKNNTVVQYALYLCFKDSTQILKDDESKSLRDRKERKAQLSRSICSLFQFPQGSIEIGFIKIVSDGCVINIVHYVFEEQLKRYQKGQLKMQGQSMRGLNLQIEPLYYLQHLCMDHHDQLTTVVCNHFHLNNAKRFMVKFVNDDMDEDYLNASHQQMRRFGQTKTTTNLARLAPLTGYHQLLSSSYSNMKSDKPNDEQKANVAEVELIPTAHPQQYVADKPLVKIQSIFATYSSKMALLQEEARIQISSIAELLETEGNTAGDNQGSNKELTLIQGTTNEEFGE
eukprot:884261_1